MKLKVILSLATVTMLVSNCKKNDYTPAIKKYPSDVANAWMQLQIKLTKSTVGYNSVVSDRSFSYAGITLYESISPDVPGSMSLLSQIGGTTVAPTKNRDANFWPASLNAAMAFITKQFLASTSAANMFTIDSLETAYTTQFHNAYEVQKKLAMSFLYTKQLDVISHASQARPFISDSYELYWKIYGLQEKTDSAYNYYLKYIAIKRFNIKR